MASSPEAVTEGSLEIKEAIQTALKNKTPLLISRHGSFEFQCVAMKLRSPQSQLNMPIITILHKNAGVFPRDVTAAEEWLAEYWKATCHADGMATGWYLPTAIEEKALVKKYNPKAFQFPLRSLESYYVDVENRWTSLFANRRVTVVSSFAKTMQEQVLKAKEIWGQNSESLLPSSTKWSFVRCYYPSDLTTKSTAWPNTIKSWKDAVDSIVSGVEETDPEIVLIGCGALAGPAGLSLKGKGRIVIVLGGAIQVLFGIKGGRWKNHAIISQFWNDSWVYPSETETPSHAISVENKCYW